MISSNQCFSLPSCFGNIGAWLFIAMRACGCHGLDFGRLRMQSRCQASGITSSAHCLGSRVSASSSRLIVRAHLRCVPDCLSEERLFLNEEKCFWWMPRLYEESECRVAVSLFLLVNCFKDKNQGKCAAKKTFWRTHTPCTSRMITNCILPTFDQSDKSWLRKEV